MDTKLLELLQGVDLIVLSEWRLTPDKFYDEDLVYANITDEASEYIGDIIMIDSWDTLRGDDGHITYYLKKWDKIIRFCYNNHSNQRQYFQVLQPTYMDGVPYPIYDIEQEII